MMRTHSFIHNNKISGGQSSLEFAILVITIVAALIAMQVYLKRGLQGRLRDNIEAMGGQYDPAATNSEYNVLEVSNTTTTTKVEPTQVSIQHCSGPGSPYCTQTIDTVTTTTMATQTHYDNSTRNGWEVVGNAV